MGVNDDRHLWPEMLRIIASVRPSWVCGENVGNFVNMALDLVLSDLEKAGYSAWSLVIPALAVNAPHQRDRVWIITADTSGEQDRRQVTRGLQSISSRVRQCDVATDTSGERSGEAREFQFSKQAQRIACGGSIVTDAASPSTDGYSRGTQSAHPVPGNDINHHVGDVWQIEPLLRGGDDGISAKLDVARWRHRLHALGNSIVPAVAYPILAAIYDDLTGANAREERR
jgi:DNA (cytosine-5)-methyltransferase 1